MGPKILIHVELNGTNSYIGPCKFYMPCKIRELYMRPKFQSHVELHRTKHVHGIEIGTKLIFLHVTKNLDPCKNLGSI
jgi:hypothetical protein